MLYNETVHKMFASLMERFDKMERAFERMNKLKDCLDGDTLLDNYDLCRLLGVTKRTLAGDTDRRSLSAIT